MEVPLYPGSKTSFIGEQKPLLFEVTAPNPIEDNDNVFSYTAHRRDSLHVLFMTTPSQVVSKHNTTKVDINKLDSKTHSHNGS